MNKLFVGSLSWDVTTEDLIAAFEVFGELVIEQTKVITDRETGKSRGFGFVEYASADAAKDAMEKMNGAMIKDRAINVSFAKPKEERSNDHRGGFGGDRRGGGGYSRGY